MRTDNFFRRQAGATRITLLPGLLAAAFVAGALNYFWEGDDDSEPASQSPLASAPRTAGRGNSGQPSAQKQSTAQILVERGRDSAQLRPEPLPPLDLSNPPENLNPPEAYDVNGDRPWLPQRGVDPASITGRIVDEVGHPVEDTRVVLEALRFFDIDKAYPGKEDQSQRTTADFQGFYTFKNLKPGLYRVRAEPAPEHLGTDSIERTGVKTADLILKRAEPFWVKGVVTSREGQPLPNVKVVQIERPGQETVTDDLGRFSLALSLGERMRSTGLHFHSENYGDARILIGENQWANKDSTQVNIKL